MIVVNITTKKILLDSKIYNTKYCCKASPTFYKLYDTVSWAFSDCITTHNKGLAQ